MILNEPHHNGKFCLNCGSPLFNRQSKYCNKQCQNAFCRKKKKGIYSSDKAVILNIGKEKVFWGERRVKVGPDPKCQFCHEKINEFDVCLEFEVLFGQGPYIGQNGIMKRNRRVFYFCEQCIKKLKSQLN